jgi:tetratricopeptide (TPR) repeat protein
MYFRSVFLPLLLLFVSPQSSDLFRKHYEAAEAHHRAGNLAAAEAEYREILAEAYHKLGKVRTAQINHQGAVIALETAAAYRPETPEVLVDLAIAYFYTEQYRKAVPLLSKVLSRDPRHAVAHQLLGKTYFLIGEFEKAENELETALGLTPKDHDVTFTLGLAYLKQRRFAEAKQIYDRMIVQLGNRPEVRVLIGRAYRETGFLPEAIDELRAAIALDPRFPRVHYYLGLAYLLKDGMTRIGDAVDEFKRELAVYPDQYFANYYLGVIYIIEGKWEPAIGPLQNASRAEPNNPDPYFYLGQAYQNSGKYEQAIGALRKAIALNPHLGHNDYQVTNAHYRLGQSLLKAGRTAEGEKELQIASELKSKAFKKDEEKLGSFLGTANSNQSKLSEPLLIHGVIAESNRLDARTSAALTDDAGFYTKVIATAHNNVGLLRAERQDFHSAAEQFRQAAKLNPQQEGLDYNLGLAYFKSELYHEAAPPLENELRARPSNLQAKQLLGLSYFMTEDYPRASALLTEVLAAKPHDTSLFFPLALSLSKEGKTEAAGRVIQQMVSTGDSPQLHIVLGQIYYQRNETTKALQELQNALSLDHSVRLAHFYIGVIHLKMGKLDEAVREFESELALNPSDVQARYHLGFALLARQETERGISLMREVIQARPDFGNAHFELGKTLLQKGDIKGAVESLEKAAKLESGRAHIHYQLGRAYIAAGRQADGEGQLEIARQLKEKALRQANQ